MDIENHKEAVKLARESLGMSPEEFGMLPLKRIWDDPTTPKEFKDEIRKI